MEKSGVLRLAVDMRSYHCALNCQNYYFETSFLCVQKCHNKHRLQCCVSVIGITMLLVQFHGSSFHRFNWKLRSLMWLCQ